MIEQYRQHGKSPRHTSSDRDRGAALTPRSARTTRSSTTRARRHSSDECETEDEAGRDRDHSGGGEENDEVLRDDMSLC